MIVGSITLDCRSGQPDPMSEAFLQMAGVFSQLELSMIRMRVRSGMANAKGKGEADREAADNRPGFTSHIFEALPSVSKGAVECFGIS